MTKARALGLLSSFVIVLATAASAQATVTASTVTSPASGSGFLNDSAASSSTVLFTVKGTTTGSGNVDIDCYDGYSGTPNMYRLVTNATVTDHSFSVPVTDKELDSAGVGGPGAGAETCVLRAVDTGDSTDYRPGSASAFSGPTISITLEDLIYSGKYTTDYGFGFSGLDGVLDLASAGSDGLQSGFLYTPGSLSWSKSSFDGVGGLYGPDANENSEFPNGEIKVDGAYTTDSASGDPALSGYQGLSLSDSFNTATDTLTVHDDEPLLLCAPSVSDCKSYDSSGVELDRTWQTEDGGEVATQTDVFRSTDGKAHTLAVDEDDEVCDPQICETGSALASLEFPGSSSFKVYADSQTVTLPSSGPGTILFKTDSSTPAAGDGTNPQGAITYSSPPTGPVQFTPHAGSNSTHQPEFVLPYSRSIPAGGSTTLRFAYVQDYALSSVEALAEDTLAGYAPSLEITSPANGSTLRAASATVTGTATDPAGIKSLTVNGAAVTVPSDGSWSAIVKLIHGSNTISALATDDDGLTARAQITITNAAEPPVLTSLKAQRISSSSARLSGAINPEGLATTYQFRYSTNKSYKAHTKTVTAGPGTTIDKVTATIKGLKAHTSYHYELIAANALGATTTAGSFKTHKPSPTSLGARISPKTARSFPYVYMAKGKLKLPRGVSTKAACSGRITLTVKRGRHRALTARAKIARNCTWSVKLELTRHSAVPGMGKLTVTPGFPGNEVLGRLTAKPITVRYG